MLQVNGKQEASESKSNFGFVSSFVYWSFILGEVVRIDIVSLPASLTAISLTNLNVLLLFILVATSLTNLVVLL